MGTNPHAMSSSDDRRQPTGSAPPPAPWAAQLDHVHEVTLLGSADLAIWQAQLQPHGVRPRAAKERARLMIIGAQGRFLGLTFREVSVSVLIEPPAGCRAGAEAAFLVQAFNSVRFFAFCERVLFATPYLFADVQLQLEPVPRLDVTHRQQRLLTAECHSLGTSQPTLGAANLPQASGWEGYVVLPRPAGKPHATSKAFFARIEGESMQPTFDPQRDQMVWNHPCDCEVVQRLTESHFTPEQWIVRADARHAKSKTFHLPPTGVPATV